ncbi:hypothetical protein RCH18_002961 [Flavobacterium sp. PL11]|uniref:hypothetical protein n=1 Tax=Flavobacterium sp. PL11 TaxID=3071717 RepID=UPI002E023863|nr:hypothetical protein [Flavobacterium sp. PL11]
MDTNTQYNNDYGCLAFSNKLENGSYFLKWNINSESRIFPFFIYDSYQTQFFIRYAAIPDFQNCFFYYTKKMDFSFIYKEYLVLEKIRFAYKNYSNYDLLTQDDINTIQEHPYLVSLVNILQTELGKKLDFLPYEYLPLPDLDVISKNKNNNNSSEILPIISSIMNKYVNKNNQLSFEADSLVDRTIDNLRHDLFWTNFSAIDNLNDWITLYSNLKNKTNLALNTGAALKSNTLNNKSTDNFQKEKKDKVSQKLNSIIQNNQVDNYQQKISELIDDIQEVSNIAEKLDLPSTLVLRNFGKYKRIYDKIK